MASYDGIDLSPLFTPVAIGRLTLANRIVMAPMTREKSPGGIPGEDVAAYYRRRAEGGVGLIVSEGTTIGHDTASYHTNIPNVHEADALAGWSRVCREVHEAGGRIAAQLWHVGAHRVPGHEPHPGVPPSSPSGLKNATDKIGEPMSEADAQAIIAAFGRGAAAAKMAGFDAVELHGAHGYLIDQFFWAATNTRDDKWGGADVAARARFGVEIVRAVREAVGAEYPVLFRFSQWKLGDYTAKSIPTPNDLEALLGPLTSAGVDAFHCSTRRWWTPEFDGSSLNLAAWAKKLTGKPAITVGSVGLTLEPNDETAKREEIVPFAREHLKLLVDSIAQGDFDMLAVGRMLLANPDWANQIRAGNVAGIKPFARRYTATLT